MGISDEGLSERGFHYTPLQHVMCQIGTKKRKRKIREKYIINIALVVVGRTITRSIDLHKCLLISHIQNVNKE